VNCFINLCGGAFDPYYETVYSYVGAGLPVRAAALPMGGEDVASTLFIGVLTDCEDATACVASGESPTPGDYAKVETVLEAGVTYYIVVQPTGSFEFDNFQFFFDEIDHAPFAADDKTIALWHLDEGSGQAAAALPDAAWDLQLGSDAGVEAEDPSWLASDEFAEPGGMLGFDGLGAFAATTAAASFDMSDHFTIEAWVRPAGELAEGMAAAIGDQAAMYRDADGRLACWAAGDPPALVVGTTALEADTWHYVACSWGGRLRFPPFGRRPVGADVLVGRRSGAGDRDLGLDRRLAGVRDRPVPRRHQRGADLGRRDRVHGHGLYLVGRDQIFASAWSMSAMMSSGSSRPTDTRIMFSGMPAFFRSSGPSATCVVDAGCVTIVRDAPRCVACTHRPRLSMIFTASS
jgi:hypothetical protein